MDLRVCVGIISFWFAQSTSQTGVKTDPSYVTKLTVDGEGGPGPHFIARNHSVLIVCSWGNGNPPTTVHLRDRNNEIIESLNVSGDISYILPPNSCKSTGILRCDAAGSKQNMSTLLALECPPMFDKNRDLNVTVKYGEDLHENITVIGHTLNIRECWFNHVDSNISSHQCNILKSSVSSAMLQRKKCVCVVTGMVPILNLTVTLYNITDFDKGKWHLNVSNKIGSSVLDVFITVNDIPARVTSLTLNGHDGLIPNPVLRNRTVTVICTWEHVYPPSTVRLINKHEKTLLTYNDKSGKMTHEIPSVSCNDAGTFRCEASGSSRNLSATLLVQCPPEFVDNIKREITAVSGRPLSLAFPVRMHSTQITKCEIARYSVVVDKNPNEVFIYEKRLCSIINEGRMEDQTYKGIPSKVAEKCSCSVNGTAPDLTFTLDVYDIAGEDGGNWQVTLANHEGQHDVNYFLIVNKDESRNSAAVAVVILVIIFIIVTIIILIKKEIITCRRLMLRRPIELFLLRALDVVRETSMSKHISNIYTDIIEIPQDSGISTSGKADSRNNGVTEDHDYLTLIHTDSQATMSRRTQIEAIVSDVNEENLAIRPDDDPSKNNQNGSDRSSLAIDYLTPVPEASMDENSAVLLKHYDTCPCPQTPIDQLTLSAESDSDVTAAHPQVTNRHIATPSVNVSVHSAVVHQVRKEAEVNFLTQGLDSAPDTLENVSNN